MNIKINGKEHTVPEKSNLLSVFELLNIQTEKGIAIALDQQIIISLSLEPPKAAEPNPI
jgi:sulfur carrier protein ThiS